MSRFLEKLEFVKPADLVSGLKMLVSIPYAACLKKKRKQMWLVCEEYNEARQWLLALQIYQKSASRAGCGLCD